MQALAAEAVIFADWLARVKIRRAYGTGLPAPLLWLALKRKK